MIKATIWCFFSEGLEGFILKNNIDLKKKKTRSSRLQKAKPQDDGIF